MLGMNSWSLVGLVRYWSKCFTGGDAEIRIELLIGEYCDVGQFQRDQLLQNWSDFGRCQDCRRRRLPLARSSS